jgi:hypothetical protein
VIASRSCIDEAIPALDLLTDLVVGHLDIGHHVSSSSGDSPRSSNILQHASLISRLISKRPARCCAGSQDHHAAHIARRQWQAKYIPAFIRRYPFVERVDAG